MRLYFVNTFSDTKLTKSVSQRVSSGQQFAAAESPVRTFQYVAVSHTSVESPGKCQRVRLTTLML